MIMQTIIRNSITVSYVCMYVCTLVVGLNLALECRSKLSTQTRLSNLVRTRATKLTVYANMKIHRDDFMTFSGDTKSYVEMCYVYLYKHIASRNFVRRENALYPPDIKADSIRIAAILNFKNHYIFELMHALAEVVKYILRKA